MSALTIWRVFFYFPQAHRNPLYEYANSTQQLASQIGPNTVSIRLVARNDRAGTVFIEDGKGQTVNGSTPHQEQVLKDCSSWLDVVQIELEPGPDLLDVLQVRIFNHETHEIINKHGESFGWRVVRPNVIQIYGLGKKIPEKIDLWLRMESYDPNAEANRLDPLIGSTCDFKEGTITVTDLCNGCNMHTIDSGFSVRPPKQHNQLAIEFEWRGKSKISKRKFYHFKVLDRFENRLNYSAPHYLRFNQSASSKQPIFLDSEQYEIDHFEFRELTHWPEGNTEVFCFSALELPHTSKATFAKPPIANVLVHGQEIDNELQEFAPLDVSLAIYRGDMAHGTASNDRFTSVKLRGDRALNLDSALSVIYAIKGMGYLATSLELLNEEQEELKVTGKVSTNAAWNNSSRAGYQNQSTPLEELDTIKFTFESQ